ncbi:hypothetical protein GCM10022386_05970 [Flavobacterium cheonhonense]|uniref:Uncharacterized protein n=1 Tax=Flavobacterium cheonhonense TaxID=706185 RepID=A0ABP7TFL1_9FLAO|nr:hypothetical protein [Flavobacterium cheonhonense]PJE42481.1 MAG: hypothetical protein CUR32_04980 [Flavobacterium sp.] [Flavobacterium sp. FEMGT703F]
MGLSEFIIDSKVGDIEIGVDISYSKMNFDVIQSEDGGTPALLELKYERIDFQITSFRSVVIGISYDFEYTPNKFYEIKHGTLSGKIGYKSNLNDVQKMLDYFNLEYKIFKCEKVESTELHLLKSNIILKFINPQLDILCKAYVFDMDLYNKISNV